MGFREQEEKAAKNGHNLQSGRKMTKAIESAMLECGMFKAKRNEKKAKR